MNSPNQLLAGNEIYIPKISIDSKKKRRHASNESPSALETFGNEYDDLLISKHNVKVLYMSLSMVNEDIALNGHALHMMWPKLLISTTNWVAERPSSSFFAHRSHVY